MDAYAFMYYLIQISYHKHITEQTVNIVMLSSTLKFHTTFKQKKKKYEQHEVCMIAALNL